MKEKLTLKDCTKENFEKSLQVLEDAERAYKEVLILVLMEYALSDKGFNSDLTCKGLS